MTKKQKKTLELYIHIPFCARKCLYCDFLSFRTLAAVHETYVSSSYARSRRKVPPARNTRL